MTNDYGTTALKDREIKKNSLQKKVAIYTRVSTIEQAEEGYSIDEQVRVLREYCDDHGYAIFQEYADKGISGKNVKGRPGLVHLLNDASNKQFDLVLVWKMNRLSRKLSDLTKIEELLKKHNIAFRSYKERYETETPSGKLQFHMMAAIAEFERDNIAENVKMGMLARAREGSWNGGQVLGYDVISTARKDGRHKLSELVVNEQEASIVRKIFDLYTSGNGYKSMANRLNQEGYRTKKNKMFSISSMKTIVTNPLYVGLIRYNVRRDWAEKRRNNINPDPLIVKGKHEPIITEETWEQAKAIKASRGGKPNRIHSGEHPLTGIMRCPACGAGMVLGRTTNRLKDGTKRVLEYYVCGRWKNKGTAACRSNGVRIDYADKYVLEKISTIANNDLLIKRIVDNVNTKRDTKIEPLRKEQESIQKQLSLIDSKKNKVLELYEEGMIGKTDFKKRFDSLDEEIKRLERHLEPLMQQQAGSINQIKLEYKVVEKIMKNFVEVFKHSLNVEQRKSLVRILIKEITISDSREIDTIKIQLNEEVLKYFSSKDGDKSSYNDDLSLSFSFTIDINQIQLINV